MVAQLQKFSGLASKELLDAMRQIARRDGRTFEAVLEDAMRDYIDSNAPRKPRPEFMAHYHASVEKNRLLYELLAE